LALGGSSTATNEIQGVIQDNNTGGVGLISVSLGASSYDGGTWKLSGANTYSGTNTISYGGVLVATTLANGGSNCSIGAATNAAANLAFGSYGGILRYVGSANASTDRAFTFAPGTAGAYGHAMIESSGAGTLSFTDSSVALSTATGKTLTLGGTNTGTNTFGKILDSTAALTKSGAGRWILTGTNTYTGDTTLKGGVLDVDLGGSGLPGLSKLVMNGGVLQASGAFTRTNNTGISWTLAGGNGGGFSARGGKLTVTIGNDAAAEQLCRTSGGGNNLIAAPLLFGSASANAEVELQNKINLLDAVGTTNRVIDVAAGAGGDFATLSGVIRNSAGTAGVVKTGAGTLKLAAANTYNGGTTVSNGTLLVDNTTGSGTGTNTVTVNAGGYVGGDGSIGGNLVMAGGGFAAQVGKVLDVGGNLDLSAANDSVIVLGAMPTGTTLVLKYSGSLTGTFNNIPTGYTVTYDTTNKEISIGPAAPAGTVVSFR
jgi:fibronectin-binding autotransporter adhesin